MKCIMCEVANDHWKNMLGLLEQELPVVVSHHVGSENWTLVLCKNSEWSYLLSHLSSKQWMVLPDEPSLQPLHLLLYLCPYMLEIYNFGDLHIFKNKLFHTFKIWDWGILCNCHLTTVLWIMMNEDTFSKSFSQGDAFSLTCHHWRGSTVGGRWLMSQYKRQGNCWKVHVSSGTLPHAWECMTVNKNSALAEQIINNSQIKTACLVERIHEKSWNDWQALTWYWNNAFNFHFLK